MSFPSSSQGPGKRGDIVAHDVSWASQTGKHLICCGHAMFLNKIRNIFRVPGTKFVSATNVARAGKQGNIYVGNNVSATMCPRLLGLLLYLCCIVKHSVTKCDIMTMG